MSEGGVASASVVGPPTGMQVRLSSNESPFGPSPHAVEAMTAAVREAHRYPDDQSTQLREAIAAHEGLDVDAVAVGNGSANILMDLIAQQVRGGGDASVLAYARAFIVYRLAAQVHGARYVEAPVGPRYRRDPQALLDRVDATTAIVCIDNPGNPTGDHLRADELRALVEGLPDDVTVVIDEAYHHFARGTDGYATVRELGLEHPRLLVLRTFSKAYALAGQRVGYVHGPAELVQALDAERSRFNVNRVAQAGAVASLADGAHLTATIVGTRDGRDRMVAGLRDLGADVVDGLGNFVLIELGREAAPVVAAYATHGVGVRPLVPYGLDQQIRVTVGTPDEVDAFLDVSAQILS